MQKQQYTSYIVKIIITSFATTFFLLLFFKLQGSVPFAINTIQTNKDALFQVQGTGEISQVPDTAIISFAVTKQAKTVLDAQNQTNTAITNIVNGLKSLSINDKDIKTIDYSVDPDYDYSADEQRIIGYTVTQSIELRVKPLDMVNKATDTITRNGGNKINDISFGFDTNTQKTVEEKARNMAIANAKEKAQSMANASGMKLGKIINIEEGSTPYYDTSRKVMNSALNTEVAPQAPSAITPGKNSLTKSITLTYEVY